jgi:RNA polymerase sigma-B factor
MRVSCSSDSGVEGRGGAGAAPLASAAGEEEERCAGELVLEHLGVADAVAHRFRCPGHDSEDLSQVARLALVKAARRYRRDQAGHGFVPYAVATVTGELKRYLRDQSWAVRPPRGVLELRLRVNAARGELVQALGREPTAGELGLELGVSAQQAREALVANTSMVPEPIEQEEHPEDEERRRFSVVAAADDPGFERVESLHDLAGALRDCSGQERELLRLRFVEELTQGEIGQRLGVSQMQVSRLLRRTLDRLRDRMAA